MMGYIVKSTICLGIVLIVYMLALEREKMHKFNRAYLLFGLLLSLVIAFLPSGEIIEQVYTSSPALFNDISRTVTIQESAVEVNVFAWLSWKRLLIAFYSIGLVIMLIRFVKNVSELIFKASRNDSISYHEAKLVLLEEETLPHTFFHNIYVNEKQYRNGNIDEKLLAHELAHVSQKHSWDVVFVELLKAIFWFNPLLIIYKRVMQLNHEFLADEAVINEYNEVSTYLHLLVDTCQNNNQIYLASNINFLLTKKRLKMMTKQSSRKRIYMLMAGVVPVAIALVMLLGQPVIAQAEVKESSWIDISNYLNHEPNQNDPISKDKYFEKTIVHYKSKDGNVMVKSYNSLPKEVRDLLPPPPPNPPMLPGQKKSKKLQPLKKGTVIHLKPNGSIVIGNDREDIDFPMPPPPPKPPKAPRVEGIVPPPPPPKAPSAIGIVPPPPPNAPIDLENINTQKATYYLDGKKTTEEVIENMKGDDVERVNVVKENGGTSINFYSKKGMKTPIEKNKAHSVPNKSADLEGMTWRKDGAMQINGKTIRELSTEGADIYLDQILLTPDEVIALKEQTTYSHFKITNCNDEGIIVELEK